MQTNKKYGPIFAFTFWVMCVQITRYNGVKVAREELKAFSFLSGGSIEKGAN